VSGGARRSRTGWRSNTRGAVISFAIEALVVVLLLVAAFVIAAAALWMV